MSYSMKDNIKLGWYEHTLCFSPQERFLTGLTGLAEKSYNPVKPVKNFLILAILHLIVTTTCAYSST